MAEMDESKRYTLVIANLMVQGLFEQTEEGIKITAKGKIVARDKWIKVSPEDRLLFTWLLRSLYDSGAL